MNTRLQVEHPVTEAVTGLDLVEWQLRVAAGEPLPLAQDRIPLRGHAVEARIYAEDAGRDFMPSTGMLEHLHLAEGPGVRVDTGVVAGDAVTPHYDPMIAKMIATGPNRRAAFATLVDALAASEARGLTTNIGFLARLAADDEVLAGEVDTGLIARKLDALSGSEDVPAPLDWAVAAAVLTGLDAPGPLAGWRAWGPGWSHAALTGPDGGERTVAVRRAEDGLIARVEEAEIAFSLGREGPRLRIAHEGAARWVDVHDHEAGVTLADGPRRLAFARIDVLERAAGAEGSGDEVRAPLPGMVKSMSVAPGDHVEAGTALGVMEAMKMEHTLKSPRAGEVAAVEAEAGDQVAEGTVLVRLAPAE